MKGLFRLSIILIIIFIAGIICLYPAASANAASRQSTIDLDKLLGRDIQYAIKLYGKQARIDQSEYGFEWYIFNKNYNKFIMLGMDDGQVVAAYCNSKYLLSQGYVGVGMSRGKVRAKFGKPLTSLRVGNTIYVLPNTDQADTYLINGYYVHYFYDVFNHYKVTSVLQIKQVYEDSTIGKNIEFNEGFALAYSNQSVDLVNSIRKRFGRKTLKVYKKAVDLAVYRSTDMIKRNYFSHYTPEGESPAELARKMGIHYKALGEDIAYGYRNSILAFESFMNSKGHRRNILYRFNRLGVGTAFGGNYVVMVTYEMLKM